MVKFETVNELTLQVTCSGHDVIYTKAGAFIAGESRNGRNFRFEKVLLGPQGSIGQAMLGQLLRRGSGENLPLMKVFLEGDSMTYYANYGQHVIVYQLAQGEAISVESENLLAFSQDCGYRVSLLGSGVFSQKGIATTLLEGRGPASYVAVLSDGNPVVLSNAYSHSTISADPDAVICWIGDRYSDPQIKADVNWKTFIGQASGESYVFEWSGSQNVTVIVQPSERKGGIQLSVD